jgi:hypothetical protein|nr:MAG TPA: hypothetical protein [Caudoviricetes sp.]
MNILLWLTDRVAYQMIKKLRWDMEIAELADKIHIKRNRYEIFSN